VFKATKIEPSFVIVSMKLCVYRMVRPAESEPLLSAQIVCANDAMLTERLAMVD